MAGDRLAANTCSKDQVVGCLPVAEGDVVEESSGHRPSGCAAGGAWRLVVERGARQIGLQLPPTTQEDSELSPEAYRVLERPGGVRPRELAEPADLDGAGLLGGRRSRDDRGQHTGDDHTTSLHFLFSEQAR